MALRSLGRRFSSGSSKTDSTEDSFFKLFIEAASGRFSRRLNKDLSVELGEKLIGVVTKGRKLQGKFMEFAMGGPSRFSIEKTYDRESACRAFSKVVCPLGYCLCAWGIKWKISKIKEEYDHGLKKKAFETYVEQNLEAVTSEIGTNILNLDQQIKGTKESVDMVKSILNVVASKLEDIEKKIEKKKTNDD